MHLGGVGVRSESISKQRPTDDRTPRPPLAILLDVDVEGRYTRCAILHPLFQLGGIRASQIRHLHLSEMGERVGLGHQYASCFSRRRISYSKLRRFLKLPANALLIIKNIIYYKDKELRY